MRRSLLLLGVTLGLLGASAAPAVEFTTVLTPQLAGVDGVRLFVRPNSNGGCDLPADEMNRVVKRTLTAAGIATVDGFDPSRPDWPILEVQISAFSLSNSCDVFTKVTLRANLTGAEVEGNHYYEYDVIWGDADEPKPQFHPATGLTEHASAIVRARLHVMIKAIAEARRAYPDL